MIDTDTAIVGRIGDKEYRAIYLDPELCIPCATGWRMTEADWQAVADRVQIRNILEITAANKIRRRQKDMRDDTAVID